MVAARPPGAESPDRDPRERPRNPQWFDAPSFKGRARQGPDAIAYSQGSTGRATLFDIATAFAKACASACAHLGVDPRDARGDPAHRRR